MFASKTPRDLNHDPEPWLIGEPVHGLVVRGPVAPTMPVEFAEFTPRPEFDHVQHNPVNPILAAFRERGDVEYPDEWLAALSAHRMFGGYREWDDTRSYFHVIVAASHGHRRHARKVLSRLAALEVQS